MPYAGVGDHEHNFAAQIVSFSPKGDLAAVGGAYAGDHPDPANPEQSSVVAHCRVVVFALEDGRVLDRAEQGESLDTGELSFRPGFTTLIFRDFHKGREGLRVRDSVERKELGFIANATRADFSRDGSRLVIQKPNGLAVLDAQTLREERSRPGATLGALLSNDEFLIVEGRRLKGWNVRTGAETFVFTLPEGQELHGSHVFESIVTLVDKTPARNVSLWDVRTGKRVAQLDEAAADGSGRIRRVDSGHLLAFHARSQPGEIVLYDTLRKRFRGRVVGVIVGGWSYNTAARSALSPDGRLLAAPSRQHLLGEFGAYEWPEGSPHTINLWDVETRQKIASLSDCDIAFWGPGGHHLATLTLRPNGMPSLVEIWEVTNPTVTFQLDGPVRSISVSPDGRGLAVEDQVWDVVDSAFGTLQPRALPLAADYVAFGNTGAIFAAQLHKTGSADQLERPTPFWQLAPTRRERNLPTFERVGNIAYASDGKMAAVSPNGRLAAILWQRDARDKRGSYYSGWKQLELWDLLAPMALGVLWRQSMVLTIYENGSSHRATYSDGHTVADPRRIAWTTDSKKLAVAFGGGGGVVIYDVPGRQSRWRWAWPISRVRRLQRGWPGRLLR